MNYDEQYGDVLWYWRRGLVTELEARAELDSRQRRAVEEAIRSIKKGTTMSKFKVGDKVRLKDSPYKGVIEDGVQGWAYVRFRLADGHQITVSDYKMLEHDIDPQPGDIYEDKNGNEWVIIKQRGWSHHPEDMIAARLISYAEGYDHSTLALTKPENVVTWADKYGPKLVRRHGA